MKRFTSRRTAALTLVMGLAVVGPARAGVCEDVLVEEPAYAGPANVESPSDAPVPVRVLLPDGYETSTQRYPVLYLLVGLSMTHDSWLNNSDVEGLASSEAPAIVVMPWTQDWMQLWVDLPGREPFERVLADELVPYIDARYRTLGDGHRAAAGPSGGGISSEIVGMHRPGLFAAVGGFSGTVDLGGERGAMIAAAFERGFWACSGADPAGAVRDPASVMLMAQDNDVVGLAPAFGGVYVWASAGTGDPCDAADVEQLADPPNKVATAWQPGEGAYTENVRTFDRALTAAGVEHTTVLRPCGIHSWRYFEQDLRAFWPVMFEAFGSPPPQEFDHRRAVPSFSVWDWTFTADPARAPEFLDVTSASCDGFGLRGSGTTTVTTAACFTPGATVLVNDVAHAADAEGRLTLTVDLGPAHPFEQFSPGARATQALDGAYWTSRSVTFDGGTP